MAGGHNMFKKLVYQISKIKTEDDRNQCFGAIDYMFNKNKINWEDHEALYALAAMVTVK
jgi:hypothetical protein